MNSRSSARASIGAGRESLLTTPVGSSIQFGRVLDPLGVLIGGVPGRASRLPPPRPRGAGEFVVL